MDSYLHIVDPFNRSRECVKMREGEYVGQYLMDKWPNGLDRSFKVFRNVLSKETSVANEELFDLKVGKSEIYHVVVFPGEAGTIIAVVAIIVAILAVILIPDPKLPPTGDDPNKSNSLSQQTNEVREGERVPEVFGTMKVFPDLIANTVSYWDSSYVQNIAPDGLGQQTVEEYLCITLGYINQNPTVFVGDTPISNLQGSVFNLYNPGERHPVLIDMRNASEVSDQLLKPIPSGGDASDVHQVSVGDFTTTYMDVPYSDGEYILSFVAINGQFTVEGTAGNDGTYTLTSYEIQYVINPDGHSIKSRIHFTVLEGFPFALSNQQDFTVYDPSATPEVRSIGPFYSPGKADEIWLDFKARRGIARGYNKSHSIDILITVEELDGANGDPTGEKREYVETFVGKNYDERNWTRRVNVVQDFGLSGYYRVSCENLTDEIDSAEAAQDLSWARLGSYREISEQEFSGFKDVTTCHIKLVGTELASSIRDRRTNLICTRQLPAWETGVVEDFTPELTRRPSTGLDAAYYMMTNKYGGIIAPSDIDIQSFTEFQNEGGYDRFDAILSNRHSADSDIVTILTALRGFVSRDGQLVTISYDGSGRVPSALFNRRNKAPESDKVSFGFDLSNAEDGVEVKYLNDNEFQYLETTISIPSDRSAVNPKELELIGVTDATEASDRAIYEFNKLFYQWDTRIISVTDEGWYIKPNELIYNVDNVVEQTFDGNIVSISGNTLVVSNKIPEFPSNTIAIRDKDSSKTEIFTYTRVDDYTLTLSTTPTVVTLLGSLDSDGGTIGSLYWISSDNVETEPEVFTVTEISPSEQYTDLTLAKYDPRVYSGVLPDGISLDTQSAGFISD